MVEDAPEVKRSAIAYSLNIYSPTLIEIKVQKLTERIPAVALASATGAEENIQHFKLAVRDIIAELLHYRKTFGIHEEGLKHVAEGLGFSVVAWKELVNLNCVRLSNNVDLIGFLENRGSYWKSSRKDNASKDVCIKFIENCLEKLLRITADDAVVNFMMCLLLGERAKQGTPV